MKNKLSVAFAALVLGSLSIAIGAPRKNDPIPQPTILTVARQTGALSLKALIDDAELGHVQALLNAAQARGLNINDPAVVQNLFFGPYPESTLRTTQIEYRKVWVIDQWMIVCFETNFLTLGASENPVVVSIENSMLLP